MYSDLHNHLLPGIDDGSTGTAETLRYLRSFAADGVSAVVFTPHLLVPDLSADRLEVELALHRERFAEVLDAAAGDDSLPDLALGQEILARFPDDMGRVAGRPDVGLAGSDALLVEFGFSAGFDAEGVIACAHAEGRTVVVAHPERYDYAGRGDPIEAVARWRDRGARIQVNGGSLAGLYGPEATAGARCLIAEGLVDLVCTDHHGELRAHAPAMIARVIDEIGEPGLAVRLMARGPAQILGSISAQKVAA